MTTLDILNKLSEQKDAVTFQFLTGNFFGFRAVPANGIRWKKGEKPERVKITYLGDYADAMQLCQGKDSKLVALIVWIPRKEFQEIIAEWEAEAGEE